MSNMKTIGIAGGVGPYAGSDLVNKIFEETVAVRDQDHLPLILISKPHQIEDRTNFLQNDTVENPGIAIAQVIKDLYSAGAEVIGIPCNTAHTPRIFNKITDEIKEFQSKISLLHMIKEVGNFINSSTDIKMAGLLCTLGTYKSKVYPECLNQKNIDVLVPSFDDQKEVHEAIYHPDYGIKANGLLLTPKTEEILLKISDKLVSRGAEALILGCTELGMVLKKETAGKVLLIDSTRVLARALIRNACPGKLKKP